MWMYAGVVLLGIIVGSFLNVCIHRLPRKASVVWAGSACPQCATRIKVHDNIPLVSYLLLKGRCRACAAPISPRYPMVEALNGIGYALIAWHFGWGWTAGIYAMLFSALLVVTFIDLSHQIIPDLITLPGIALGFLSASTILPVGLMNSMLGILLGGGILWGLAWASPYVFGKEGMGGGDVKLLAMIGAFLGWQSTLLTIVVGAVAGSVVGIGLILFKILRKDQYLPFGPFLAFGAVLALFFHHEIFAWYVDLLNGTP